MDVTQCRMARAALKWSSHDLAEAAGVARITVARFESGQPIEEAKCRAMQAAFEREGIVFFGSGVRVPPGGPGVRLPAE